MFHHTEDNGLSYLHRPREVSTRRLCKEKCPVWYLYSRAHQTNSSCFIWNLFVMNSPLKFFQEETDGAANLVICTLVVSFLLMHWVTGWSKMAASLSRLLIIHYAEYDLYFLHISGRSSLVLYMQLQSLAILRFVLSSSWFKIHSCNGKKNHLRGGRRNNNIKNCYEYLFSFLLVKYLGVEWLSSMIDVKSNKLIWALPLNLFL